MDVESPTNDNYRDEDTGTEHLPCGKHCAANALPSLIYEMLLNWD